MKKPLFHLCLEPTERDTGAEQMEIMRFILFLIKWELSLYIWGQNSLLTPSALKELDFYPPHEWEPLRGTAQHPSLHVGRLALKGKT